MKRVYYWSASHDDGSAFYRCQGVFPFISDKALEFTDITNLNPAVWSSMLGKCDILFMQRPWSSEHMGAIFNAREMGIRVIVDYDDNFLVIPEHNPAYDHYRINRNTALQCIRMANEVWVSTEPIYTEFKKYNNSVHIIPNSHNDHQYPVEKKLDNNPNHKTIFYRGGSTHKIDLFEYAEQICALAKQNTEWKIFMLGVSDDWHFQHIAANTNNISVANKIPLIQYFKHLYDLNSALTICPLVNNELNRSKSNISWMEATYCGSAFIGRKVLTEFDHDFIFDIDRLDHFYDYSNPIRMKRFNDESWQYIKENLLLSKINNLRIERLLI